jgi:hypothetical protein
METNLKMEPEMNLLSDSVIPVRLSGDLGGEVLTPGLYYAAGPLIIQAGDLTLDAGGDENAIWVFMIASDFITVGGEGGNVILCGGARSKNVFWQTDRLATIGEGTSFKGNIISKMPDVEAGEFAGTTDVDEFLPIQIDDDYPIYKKLPDTGTVSYATRH